MAWYPHYMSALARLKMEINREIDRAQVASPIPADDPLLGAIRDVLYARAHEAVVRQAPAAAERLAVPPVQVEGDDRPGPRPRVDA